MWIDTRRAQRVVPSGHFFWVSHITQPLANHFDLPGSKSVFGISQDLPVYARIS